MKVLNSFSWQRSLHLFHLLPFLCHEVAANTEIINFSSSREQTVHLPLDVLVGNWSKLHPSDNERRWTLEPAALHTPLHQVCEHIDDSEILPFSCPHELWVLLDLDDEKWASYSAFTLRLSWPASAPADFAIALYTQQDLLARLADREMLLISTNTKTRTKTNTHPTTRVRYARIRAVNAGVPTPGLVQSSLPSQPRVFPAGGNGQGTVPFIVILEPLYWGVLPATLLPTVGFLVLILLAAVWLVVPWVIAYVEPFVRQAREDMKTGMTLTRTRSKER